MWSDLFNVNDLSWTLDYFSMLAMSFASLRSNFLDCLSMKYEQFSRNDSNSCVVRLNDV